LSPFSPSCLRERNLKEVSAVEKMYNFELKSGIVGSDLSQLGNWRGINLMSLLAKLYNRVLLNRLRPVLDPLFRKNQNGFRPGRGCPEHILCLRQGEEVVSSSSSISERRLTACVGGVSHPCWLPTVFHRL